jgi:hypothetical protein
MPDGKSVVMWSKGKIIRVDMCEAHGNHIPFKGHSNPAHTPTQVTLLPW